jgi:hypothetical protein
MSSQLANNFDGTIERFTPKGIGGVFESGLMSSCC